MKEIKLDKITLNFGAGSSNDVLEKGLKLLQSLSGGTPIKTITKKRIPTWGVRPGLAVGCKVTIRGKKADELLSRLLKAVNNQLPERKFDTHGNLSFGIKEYLDIPGAKYDASIGIIGLEVAVTLKRAGFRVKNRRLKKASIPSRHLISKNESIGFIKNKFNVEVITS